MDVHKENESEYVAPHVVNAVLDYYLNHCAVMHGIPNVKPLGLFTHFLNNRSAERLEKEGDKMKTRETRLLFYRKALEAEPKGETASRIVYKCMMIFYSLKEYKRCQSFGTHAQLEGYATNDIIVLLHMVNKEIHCLPPL